MLAHGHHCRPRRPTKVSVNGIDIFRLEKVAGQSAAELPILLTDPFTTPLRPLYATRNHLGEFDAYQVQSDFLTAVGVTGTPGSLDARFPNDHDVFVDLADRMEEYGVFDAAIHR